MKLNLLGVLVSSGVKWPNAAESVRQEAVGMGRNRLIWYEAGGVELKVSPCAVWGLAFDWTSAHVKKEDYMKNRKNYLAYQAELEGIEKLNNDPLKQTELLQAAYDYLLSLSVGERVDYGDHSGVLATREGRMQQVERFAWQRGIEIKTRYTV